MRKLIALSIIVLVAGGGVATSTAQAREKRAIYTGDFITATRIVGKFYGRSVENWLVNCSSSEGGHGGFVWYEHLSYPKYGYSTTPGGWMQFMGGTFYSNVRWAFQDARHRGLKAHPKARSYYEPLGQAIVAGVMYAYHGNPGTWTGGYC